MHVCVFEDFLTNGGRMVSSRTPVAQANLQKQTGQLSPARRHQEIERFHDVSIVVDGCILCKLIAANNF